MLWHEPWDQSLNCHCNIRYKIQLNLDIFKTLANLSFLYQGFNMKHQSTANIWNIGIYKQVERLLCALICYEIRKWMTVTVLLVYLPPDKKMMLGILPFYYKRTHRTISQQATNTEHRQTFVAWLSDGNIFIELDHVLQELGTHSTALKQHLSNKGSGSSDHKGWYG